MKYLKIFRFTGMAGLMLCLLCFSAGDALASSGADPSYNVLFLQPGHTQTLYFELGTNVFNNHQAIYTCYVLTVGAGTLNVRVGTASSVGQSASIIYALAGLVNITPAFRYAYNAETISYNVTVPDVGIGIFFVAIASEVGSPDYPIVMSFVVSLIADSE